MRPNHRSHFTRCKVNPITVGRTIAGCQTSPKDTTPLHLPHEQETIPWTTRSSSILLRHLTQTRKIEALVSGALFHPLEKFFADLGRSCEKPQISSRVVSHQCPCVVL